MTYREVGWPYTPRSPQPRSSANRTMTLGVVPAAVAATVASTTATTHTIPAAGSVMTRENTMKKEEKRAERKTAGAEMTNKGKQAHPHHLSEALPWQPPSLLFPSFPFFSSFLLFLPSFCSSRFAWLISLASCPFLSFSLFSFASFLVVSRSSSFSFLFLSLLAFFVLFTHPCFSLA